VLVNGAAGGVGSFAVQITKAFGANVTGVCSTSKIDLVRSIGADEGIDYTLEDIAQRHAATTSSSIRLATARCQTSDESSCPRGRWYSRAAKAAHGGSEWVAVMKTKAISPFVGQKMKNFLGRTTADDLLVLKELIETGRVTPVIGARHPLSDVPGRDPCAGAGDGRGKVVITV
jgi:NADPH:quinone reductase-like Zn-dependent oxidoreductase